MFYTTQPLQIVDNSRGCSECVQLERSYQDTVREIFRVVNTPSSSIGDKLRKLHECQDARDRAVARLYEHKKLHPQTTRSRGRVWSSDTEAETR